MLPQSKQEEFAHNLLEATKRKLAYYDLAGSVLTVLLILAIGVFAGWLWGVSLWKAAVTALLIRDGLNFTVNFAKAKDAIVLKAMQEVRKELLPAGKYPEYVAPSSLEKN
jgi:hypothetical protein